MKFQPLKEEELQRDFQLLKEGEYDFTVVHAEDKVSLKGNEYIFLKLLVWDENGKERLIFTNLALIKLLKHFCDVTGLEDKYQHGEIMASDCLDRSGCAKIIVEKSRQNLDGTMSKDRNIVFDYIKKDKKQIKFQDDDLPF